MVKLGNSKLLAIAPNPQSLATITEPLAQENLEIFCASNSATGLEVFMNNRPRTVLLDMSESDIHAMEMLERLISIDPAVNVVLISDHYSTESAVEAIQRGACDYLTKPLDFSRFRH